MEPRVTKHDKRLQLSYELPHRIHCTHVVPAVAPNGSTVIVYGHERGLRVLWKGGRRRRTTPPPRTNGASKSQDIIVIDDSDDQQPEAPKEGTSDEFEEEEDEQDQDCPYSNIIHDLDIHLDSAVLHLAIPTNPTSRAPKLVRTHAVVVVTCASGSNIALTIPRTPPRDDEEQPEGVSQIHLPSTNQPARGLSAKLVLPDDSEVTQSRSRSRGRKAEAELLVAAVSSTLNVWAVDLHASSMKKRRDPVICNVNLPSLGSFVSFHPSSRSTQLLISDTMGAVRLYDPFALELPNGQSSGKWLTSYFSHQNTSSASDHVFAQRKRVLSCAWVLGGRGVMALLEDGEWGVWDVTGLMQSQRSVEDFAISGFLGSAGGEIAETVKPKKASKLAPMTPNTRKAKSENLFRSSSKTAGSAAAGGISISPMISKSGQTDESVIMWYCGEIYAIPSMQQFWQRSTSNNGHNVGSLYAPGMTHVADINLMNEDITSISQFANAAQSSSFGQMNTQRDLAVSAEHRLIITQSIRPATPSRQLFQQAAERPVSRDRDQHMLDAGGLDLGGLNRMLDSRTDDAPPRRVGFAH